MGATGPLKRIVDILENSPRKRAGRRLELKLKLTKHCCGESVAASKLPPGSLKGKEKPNTQHATREEEKRSSRQGLCPMRLHCTATGTAPAPERLCGRT